MFSGDVVSVVTSSLALKISACSDQQLVAVGTQSLALSPAS
jgi:hypothetical protein